MTERHLYRVLRSFVALRVYGELRARGWTAAKALERARWVAG